MSGHIKDHIKPTDSLVILTGAGISAESGLQTFRASDGLWEGHRVEDVATPEAFQRNPELVHDFYNQRRAALRDPKIKPNPAHKALAELEDTWQGESLVITQNIDDLHERAGTKNLIHMHGEVLKAFCHVCASGEGKKLECHENLTTETQCPDCGAPGGLRPDIVWFSEMPYHMDRIYNALTDCDVFISIGTSGHVYPAAGFVAHAMQSGALTLEINLDPSQHSNTFTQSLLGKAGELVPEFVNDILKQ